MSKHFRYWLSYSKKGKAAFLSHLDTIQAFERALRRSGLDLRFTSGFNPHVRLSSPSALPVGLAVQSEGIGILLNSPYQPGEVAEAVGRQLPSGLRIERVDAEHDSAGRSSAGEPEELVFAIRYGGSRESALIAVESWLKQSRIEISTMRKGRRSTVDVKPHLGDISVGAEEITVRVKRAGGAFPRMSDLLQAFWSIISAQGPEVEIYEIIRL